MFLRNEDLLKLPNMSTPAGMAEMLSRFIWLFSLPGIFGLNLLWWPVMHETSGLPVLYLVLGAISMAFVIQYFLLWSKRSRSRHISLIFALAFSLPIIIPVL